MWLMLLLQYNNTTMYKLLIRPILFWFDPEEVHYFTFAFIRFVSKIPGFAFMLGETLSTLIYPFHYLGVYFPNVNSKQKLLSLMPSFLGFEI